MYKGIYEGYYVGTINCHRTNEQNLAMDLIDFHKKLEENVENKHFGALDMVKFHEKVRSSPDYKQLCRFCLEPARKKIDREIIKSFKMLTNSTLDCAPEYPKSICSLCESQLKSARKFGDSLLAVEQCWSELFRQDCRQFMSSINHLTSEEHIYDEIFLGIEVNGRDEETTSIRSFDHRPSAPLLEKENWQASLSVRSCIGQPRSVHALTLADKREYANASSELRHRKHPIRHQSAHYTRIMLNTQTPSDGDGEQAQSLERPFVPSQDDYSSENKRNHDIVSLSYERVNKCLTTENRIYERNTASEANKSEIKCVVVGEAAVGKSNLILTYLKNKFDYQHVPTASDIYEFDVDVNERLVQVILCDTAGQDSLDDLRQLSYPGCHAFLLCFSVVRPASFQAIKDKWARKFRYTSASLILVGTQSDLRSDGETIANLKKRGLRPVTSSDARKLAKSIRAKYVETSARTNEGVKNAFDAAIEGALEMIKPAVEEDSDEDVDYLASSVCMCCVG